MTARFVCQTSTCARIQSEFKRYPRRERVCNWLRSEPIAAVPSFSTEARRLAQTWKKSSTASPRPSTVSSSGALKIVELNGVTSEATHIYDPKLSLFGAYRVLFQQWRIAFEIGDLNRARGIRPASVADLLDATREYRHLAQGYPE